MEIIKYLILFELGKQGYILDMKDDFDDAKPLADMLFKVYSDLSIDELFAFLKKTPIVTYTINGDENFLGRIDYGHCNGIATV